MFIFGKIEKALNDAGAEMKDVVRTRMFVTDISRADDAGRAHVHFFQRNKTCGLYDRSKRLYPSRPAIEIEVTAIIDN